MTDENEKVGWGRTKFSVDSGVGCGKFSCVVDVVGVGDADVTRRPHESGMNRTGRERV